MADKRWEKTEWKRKITEWKEQTRQNVIWYINHVFREGVSERACGQWKVENWPVKKKNNSIWYIGENNRLNRKAKTELNTAESFLIRKQNLHTENIFHDLEYSKVHYLAHNSLPLKPVYNQKKPAPIHTPNSRKDYFNIIKIPTSSSPKWFIAFIITD